MRAALYLRVSTRDKGQDTDNQRRQLEAFCERKGYEIAEVYEDQESGRLGRGERRGFDQLFRDARLGKFDLVVFWSLDRFSREGLRHVLSYLQQLDAAGVGFHSLTEEFLSTENELVRDVLLTILAHLAKLESERISQRTKAGLERARAKGKRLGRPSKIDLALRHVRELRAQLNLDGTTATHRTLARMVSRRIGKPVSESTVRRCIRQLES